MSTVEAPTERKVQVKEMSWDPITRIVGSLGIHTEIDFSNQQVAKCYSTSMIFRGFDIFMKGIDPRDAHFITSRICGICGDNHCTCSCLNQNMAYGVKPPPLGDLAFNLAETADYIFDHAIFNDCMANVDFCERQRHQPQPAPEGGENVITAQGHPRVRDDRRHHAGPEPVHWQLLSGDAPGGALHARDVLPVRRSAHAPVDDYAGRL
jgi:Ni,Fe-hydrogenase I large subunit